MQIAYSILMFIAILIAVVFTFLVLLTSKGDAMSGSSSSVRTTFRGKASFDDYIGRVILILGGTFMALVLILDLVGNKMQS